MANWRQPAKIRRAGREAFTPNDDPDIRNPYKNERKNVWLSDSLARSWEEGWNEARMKHEELIKYQTEE